MIQHRVFSVASVVRILKNRWWILVMPAVILSVIATAVALSIPNRFRSQTVILVVPQRVPESYVRSTVTTSLEGRLNSLTQQVLSRTRLERIINDFDLYPELRATQLLDDVVTTMRRSISSQVAARSGSFTLSFTYVDPVLTAKVTDRLASLFIEENMKEREVLADDTSEFLESQLIEARRRLMEVESRLEDYRKKYSGQLPTQLESNLQMINNLSNQAQGVADLLARDRDRRVTVQTLLAELSTPILTAPAPVAAGNAQPISASLTPEQSLELARQEFSSVERRRLMPGHPDYDRAKRRLQELEREVAQHSAKGGTGNTAEVLPLSPSPAEITRRNRVAELRAELAGLERQIEQRSTQEERIREEIAMYQTRIEATPTRESEMTALTRDYATFQESYRTLLAKKQDSQIAASLERRQVGEQFNVLDPAAVPERPVSPNRPLFTGVGFVLGFVIGFAIVALLEIRDKSVHNEDEVARVFSLPVVAMIPVMITTAELAARRRRRFRLAAIGVLVVMASGAALWAWVA